MMSGQPGIERGPFVGLTGGMGSGKSAVARLFAEHGALVVDADAVARDVVAPSSEGLRAVVEAFGPTVLAEDGALDRAALGQIVFEDVEARRRLEGIVHPLIAARTAELVAAARPGQVVVHDIPLLVELGREADYDLVIVVDAPLETRLRRLADHRGIPREVALARIAQQAGDEQRRAVADVWIDNSGDEGELRRQVEALWEERLQVPNQG